MKIAVRTLPDRTLSKKRNRATRHTAERLKQDNTGKIRKRQLTNFRYAMAALSDINQSSPLTH
jgi:hypothetical protein